jgi:hypothetical protein
MHDSHDGVLNFLNFYSLRIFLFHPTAWKLDSLPQCQRAQYRIKAVVERFYECFCHVRVLPPGDA